MRIPINFTGLSYVKTFAEKPNSSELIASSTKCWSNDFHQHASKNICSNALFGVADVLTDDNFPEETGLAVAVWAVAIIFFISFFFGVLLVVGMTILVLLSFQHLTSLKKSLKSQVRLLITINKQLRRKRTNLYLQSAGGRAAIRDRRHNQNTRPLNQRSRHFHYVHHASNSPFHPRNNTPVSSHNGSFSSHASLSFSDLPSVSSFTPSVSEDISNSEFTTSSRVTAIQPVSGRSFHRSYEEIHERERQVRDPREMVHSNYRMHDNKRNNLVLRTNGRRVSLQNCPPLTSCEPIGQSGLSSPKEYWL